MQHDDFAALAAELDAGAHVGTDVEKDALVARLRALDASGWLALDAVARRSTWSRAAPLSARRAVDGDDLLGACVASMNVSGWGRERAVRLLAGRPDALAARAVVVRTLDHVAEVRTAALAVLPTVVDDLGADHALAVALAAAGRKHAPATLDAVVALLRRTYDDGALVDLLLRSPERDVRRWTYAYAHEHDALPRTRLLQIVRTERDQTALAFLADRVGDVALEHDFDQLLRSRNVDVRQVATARAPDTALDGPTLRRLLLDESPRVRAVAQKRARDRGVVAAGVYRAELGRGYGLQRVALEGLGAIGGPEDHDRFLAALAAEALTTRAVAARCVALRCDPQVARTALVPVLLDPEPSVASAAARGLAALVPPDPGGLEPAWTSEQVWSRRAAWRVARAVGPWERVEAGLRAAGDPDRDLAQRARADLQAWLAAAAATTWQPVDPDRGEPLRVLLGSCGLPEPEVRAIAFHARIDPGSIVRAQRRVDLAKPGDEASVGPGAARPASGSWWRELLDRLLGRRP